MSLQIAIHGALGRVGQLLIKLISQNPEFQLTGAFIKPEDPRLGQDVGDLCHIGPMGVPVTADLNSILPKTQVVIDFSSHKAIRTLIEQALLHKTPLVIATTGLDPETMEYIKQAAQHIPILQSANTSMGIAVLSQLVKQVKKQLPHFDVEIVEIHHRKKQDAPSGTALLLAQSLVQEHTPPHFLYGRQGLVGPRTSEEVGISAVRGGDVIGEHTVYFFGPGERLELTHRASNRELFAQGALQAATWIVSKPPGLYTLQDMVSPQSS